MKIWFGGVFWFKDDLNFFNNKNTYKQHQGWWKMTNNKKMKFSIRNDKRTTNNLTWVSKRHIRNTNGTKLNIKNFFSGNGGLAKGWGLKALHTMSKDTKGIKKYIGDVRGIKVKNILYFKQRFVGKHDRKHCMKNIGWHWKGPIF